MDSKCIKKSTLQQLQALVEHMEDNPEFARGYVAFGSTKFTVEEQWLGLTKKLNSLGPPFRTVAEWKKSWSDLKSHTKKKIAENKKSLMETGGDMYRMNTLSDLEQVIDRTLFLSRAAAPSGKELGLVVSINITDTDDIIENCFIALKDTPPRNEKSIAVVTPSRQQQNVKEVQRPRDQCKEKKQHEDNNDDQPSCSSAKKRKTLVDEQISLIKRQLRAAEHATAIAKEQADSTKILADATKALAETNKRIADAVEVQSETASKHNETQSKILVSLETITKLLAENLKNQRPAFSD